MSSALSHPIIHVMSPKLPSFCQLAASLGAIHTKMADDKRESSFSGTFTWVILQFPVPPEAKPYMVTVSDELKRNFWATALHDAFRITTQSSLLLW